MNDMEILRRAWDHEHDSRNRLPPDLRSWEYYTIGASKDDVRRLVEEGMLIIALKNSNLTKYKLSPKGADFVFATTMEREMARIPAATIVEAMSLIVGFDDIKDAISKAIESQRRIHFLLEGPPACAKSIMLEGVRSAVPGAYIAFGSRTSASGLSEALFEHQPRVLLLDETDKMRADCFSVLLGLMESGEIIETKVGKTRGVKLETMVIGACNSSSNMPREVLSRFAMHVLFPTYTRDEFIEVCQGFLTRAEDCPEDLASNIGRMVFDQGLGDVRKARAVWQLMHAPSIEEVQRVIHLMLKYNPSNNGHRRQAKKAAAERLC